jgi:hypothetical protein
MAFPERTRIILGSGANNSCLQSLASDTSLTGRIEHLYKEHIPCRSVAYKQHETDTMESWRIVDVVFGYQFLLGPADRFSSDQSAHEFLECSISTVLCPY